MSKLKQKYPIKKKAQQASRDGDSMDMDDQTDGDIIRCVCDDSDDDGFTIQCEHCENWQHASCVNIKKNNIPEHYMCDRCSRKLSKRDNATRRRNSSSETDKKPKSKKPLKRAIPKKRVYSPDSDDGDSTAHHTPPTISKTKFTPLSKNVFKEKLVEHLLIEVHRQWMESNKPKSFSGKSKVESPSTSSSAAAKGLESIVVMESNLLLPAIPKASVKPLRRSLRGSFLQNQRDPSVEKGVFADIHIPEHRYLMEVTGEYARKSEYKNDPDNNFTLLGTPPAHVFFFRNIDICIDARFAGNDTRYIRRSCSPNSEIRGIILPNDSDDHTIHMGIYTTEEVDRGEEITISWNWQRGYLMWNKNKEFLRQDHRVEINPSEVDSLKQSLNLLASEFGECACEDKEECLIECLKDELEKQDDDQYAAAAAAAAAAENDNTTSSSKRKRLSHSSSGSKMPRSDNNEHYKPGKKGVPRASDIFSSDEESKPKSRRSSVGSNKEEHKQVKLIKKSTSRRNPVNAPTSPTVSQADSVDIDIISMSPVPSQPTSETESETQLPNYKRPRPLVPGDIRLPIKKRWLLRYLNEQQEMQQKEHEQLELERQRAQASVEQQPQSEVANPSISSPAPDPASTEDTSRNTYHGIEQDDSSDGASSDSTLPLEDTPKIQQGHVDQQQDKINTVPDTTTHPTATALPQGQDQDTSNHPTGPTGNNNIADSGQPEPSSSSSSVYPIDNKMEQVKQAKKKLSLQEYLLMRRGNLPTPDEKHSSAD
ncbi:Phosphopantothenate--cysteine ligase cab2 [Mucor velutinosus]|uniref:Phosphopantothenate--cysteine ligase cab2 n=1 Tax=Mucor velutinosus TaxID=708070 RepID=A0AAN7DCB4_9FUNG|nr:Phosphopantothenate--cysteine ligase cab2 [Mucor velutinosus]